MEVGYLSEDPPLIYEIPTSNFLPTFYTSRNTLTGIKYNEEDVFEWTFSDFDTNGVQWGEAVGTVNCADLIESFTDLLDDEKKSMIKALT